jgi:signal transduction histidine kinase
VPAVPEPQTPPVGRARGPEGRVWTSRLVVPVLLALYLAVVYAATVLAGRALLGRAPGAGFGLTVLAAAVAASTLEPLRAWFQSRLPPRPQDRLARLARGVLAEHDLVAVLRSTSQLLQEGLGATSVEIRPGPATGGDEGADVTLITMEGSAAVLGCLRVTMPAGTRLSPRDRALLSGVVQGLATILRTAALRDALRATMAEAELRTADLRLSRQRIVLTSHRGRRQVERDIHDGAQQHLVALAVHLGLLRSLVAGPGSESGRALETARSSAVAAVAALDELSQGLYPARLAEHGPAVALRQAARSSPLRVAVDARDLPRTDADVEAAVYFCCLEAMQNAAKHAQASAVDLRLRYGDGTLTFTVTDDGRGFLVSSAPAGAGIHNMRDRLEVLGGTLRVTSVPGAGTTVSGEVPAYPRPRHPAIPVPRSGSPRPRAGG